MAVPANPCLNNRFRVEIDGLVISDFSEVILPDSSADIVEYREGNDGRSRKLPGAAKYGNIVLRRGVTASNELFDWWKTVAEGAASRRSLSVTLLDQQGAEVKRWNIQNAWPARYMVSPLIALDGDAVVLETLECATEGFAVVA
jgi:phage tail-like protein